MQTSLRYRFAERRMPVNLIRFYAVGLLLFGLPYTRGVFISITALSLVLVAGVVFWFHREWNRRTVLWLLFIAVSSFFLEMEGVNAGRIFGAYRYERALGPQVNGTPLIIGLNWALLIYAAHDLAARVVSGPWGRVLLGAAIMVGYDVILEWIAPPMQMWSFAGGYPPLRNFVAWLVASLVYLGGFEVLGIRFDNPTARAMLPVQAAFFIAIGIIANVFMV